MKKITAIVLIALMVASLAVTAFAGEPPTVVYEAVTSAEGWEPGGADNLVKTPDAAKDLDGFGALSLKFGNEYPNLNDADVFFIPVKLTKATAGNTLVIDYYVASNTGAAFYLYWYDENSSVHFDYMPASEGYHKFEMTLPAGLLADTTFGIHTKSEVLTTVSFEMYVGRISVREGAVKTLSYKTEYYPADAIYATFINGMPNHYPSAAAATFVDSASVPEAAAALGEYAGAHLLYVDDSVGYISVFKWSGLAKRYFEPGQKYRIIVYMYITAVNHKAENFHMWLNDNTENQLCNYDLSGEVPYSDESIGTVVPLTFTFTKGTAADIADLNQQLCLEFYAAPVSGYIAGVAVEGPSEGTMSPVAEGTLDARAMIDAFGAYSGANINLAVLPDGTEAVEFHAHGGFDRCFSGLNRIIGLDAATTGKGLSLTIYNATNGDQGLPLHNAGNDWTNPLHIVPPGYSEVYYPGSCFPNEGECYMNFVAAEGTTFYIVSMTVANPGGNPVVETWEPAFGVTEKVLVSGENAIAVDGLDTDKTYLFTIRYRLVTISDEKTEIALNTVTKKLEAKDGFYSTSLAKTSGIAASKLDITVPDNTAMMIESITYTVAGDEYSALISMVEQLAVDIKLDSKIATTPEYAIADLQKTLQTSLGDGYLVEVTLIDNGFESPENTVASLFLPAFAAGSVKALVKVTDIATSMFYETELTFAITGTATSAAMPTGDMIVVVSVVSVLAVLALAGVVIFKKRVFVK